MSRQAVIERAEKRPAAGFEVLPGVLAVKDDGDERLCPAGAVAIPAAGFDKAADEVVRRGVGVPAGIGESDQVRQHVIAEGGSHRDAPGADPVRRVEPFRLLDVAAAVA
jgi:hypothetical protein